MSRPPAAMKRRTIPLTVDARRGIARYLAERQRPDPEDYLFISRRTGGRLSSKAVRQLAGKYGYQAMVEDAHAHAFRHSFATELLRKGAPLPTVGALLGHESLQSTARYTQPSERDLRDAVNKLAPVEER